MKRIDDIKFFTQNTISLAQSLIGKWIETNIDGKVSKAQITETEAYLGVNDSACHSYCGRRTTRTEPMWQEGGTIYVYLCYGLHYLFNIVSCSKGVPEAVLIRAVSCANGPAKTTKFLNIDKKLNGQSMVGNNQIALFDDQKKYQYLSEKRVGIDYALKKDREALLRFIMKK